MIYRKLDTNGDMVFGIGQAGFLSNTPETVAQAISTVLKLFQGEWFINTQDGVPYMDEVLGFGNSIHFNFVIRDAILSTTGVLSIDSFSSYIDQNRNAVVNATVNTIYGVTTLSVTL